MGKILIWAEHAFQLYSVKPVADKYRLRGKDVYLMTEMKELDLCARYLSLPRENILHVSRYRKKWQSLLVKLFEVLFVSMDYSIVYADNNRNEKGWARSIRNIRFIKLPKNRINSSFNSLASLLRIFGYRSIPEHRFELLISFTKVYNVLLLPQGIPHISIMESWDHPIKLPYFTEPDYCLTWNADLKRDTMETQQLFRVRQISPLKFRYIKERALLPEGEILAGLQREDYREEILRLREMRTRGKVILYPATTSSNGIEHEGEMKLIGDICKALENTGNFLYIKPKPNGPKGDYDAFAVHPHVFVGSYSSHPDSRDMLDENYHSFRYLILKNSDVVLNAGTTFVLEAAMMDRLVVQLDISNQVYGGFGEFVKTYHLTRYILSVPGCLPYAGEKENLAEAIKDCSPAVSVAFKAWISNWKK